MGLDFHALHLLLHAKENYGEFGDTLTLARQEIHLNTEDLDSVGSGPHESKYLEPLLQEFFGSTNVDSVDYSNYESANIIHDLNLPINSLNFKRYDTVIDLGTSEHLFNVATGLLNIINLTGLNGTIIHCLPANNFSGHGFWQFSPELFFSLYSEQNGFQNTKVYLADLSEKKYWYEVEKPMNGQRVNITSKNFLYVMCTTTKISSKESLSVFQSDYIELWTKKTTQSLIPQNTFLSIGKKIKSLFPKKKTRTETRRDFAFSKKHPQLNRVKITLD